MPLIQFGTTTNFVILYDSTLSGMGGQPDGAGLSQAVLDYCEYDLARLQVLFGNVALSSLPINIQVLPATPTQGGGWNNGVNLIKTYVNTNTTTTSLPALVVAELGEILMTQQNMGWIEGWSNGEALSRVLGALLYPQDAIGFSGGAASWLNSSSPSTRPDWVSNVDQTDQNGVSYGCGMLFLNYLAYQLNYKWTSIIQAAAPATKTLGETAQLLGTPNAWTAFSQLMATQFPNPVLGNQTDDPYPIGALPPNPPLLYMRHNTADDGTTHAPPLSQSPDIIVRNNPVADPQTTFSTPQSIASATESDPEVIDTQANYVYVRAWNRGGTDGTNAFAVVYWSPPATLVTPNLWTYIGSAYFPDVPTGSSVRVVNPGITWPSDRIPAPGHYCFVAAIGNADDVGPFLPGSPGVSGFASFQDYVDYVANHNNVVWRNFDVVQTAMAHIGRFGEWIELPFLISGAWDRAHEFELETVADLPKGSRLAFQVAEWIGRGLRPSHTDVERHGDPTTDPKNRRRLRIHLPADRARHLGHIELPTNTASPSHLLVRIPAGAHQRPHEVAIRQIYRGREVGRLTWRLMPPKRTQ
jgi:hypothetical protein